MHQVAPRSEHVAPRSVLPSAVARPSSIAQDLAISQRDSEIRALQQHNHALARQSVAGHIQRLPPGPRDASGSRAYELEKALVVEREKAASALKAKEAENEALRRQAAATASASGDVKGLILQERIGHLEAANAAANDKLLLLERERNLAGQQQALWAAQANRLGYVVNAMPVSESQLRMADKQALHMPEKVSEGQLRKENAVLRSKLEAARADLHQVQASAQLERERRLHSRAEYAGREADEANIALANVERDVQVLAKDNLRLRRKAGLLQSGLVETERRLYDEVAGHVADRPRVAQLLAEQEKLVELRYAREIAATREREAATAGRLAVEQRRVRIRHRPVPVPVLQSVRVPVPVLVPRPVPQPVPFEVPYPVAVADPVRVPIPVPVVQPVPQPVMVAPRPMPMPMPPPPPPPAKVSVRYYMLDPSGREIPLPGPPARRY